MRRLLLPFAVLLSVASGSAAHAQGVPHAAHVVVVVMENQSYNTVKSQPYTASLIAGGALMSNAYAVTHPSQPNYLALWSASTQGVTNDNCPSPGSPYSGENLGHACEANGLTWRAYEENLPSVGSTVCFADGNSSTGLYTRKHAPWTDFTNDTHSNERPYTDLATDLANHTLPSLSFVIPNNCDNSHNGGSSCGPAHGDTWLSQNVPAILAALGSDGVLILTWDEDDNSASNHILTVFSGAPVLAGVTSTGTTTHYRLVRTICDLLGVASFANAATETPVSDIWKPFAQTITWNGLGGDGSWHSAANWNLARAPIAGDAVVIPDVANTSVVTYSSGSTTVASLSCAEALTVSGGTLAITAAFAHATTIVAGPGTLRADAGYTQTGGTTRLAGGSVVSATLVDIQGGSLTGSGTVSGALRNAAFVAPGASPGAITVSGDYTQTSSGQLAVELAGTTQGTQYDALLVGGAASLDGALSASLIGGYVPGGGEMYDVLTAASRSGTFASTNLPLAFGGGCVNVSLLSGGVRLAASAAPAFTLAPLSQSVCEGDSVTLTVATNGDVSGVQWRKNGADIGGATSTALTFASVALADSGVYDCVATGTCGLVASDAATLGVTNCVVGSEPPVVHPLAFHVAAPAPNPMATGLSLPFTLPRSAHVRVTIFNARGALVATPLDATLAAGEHRAAWNGRNSDGSHVSAGVYCCRFSSALGSVTSRFVVLR